MTPVAVAPAPPTRPRAVPAAVPAGHPARPVTATVWRLFPMCAAAIEKEQRGEAGARFHGYCRGRAANPTRALGRLPNGDGRLSAGRHRCTCSCHDVDSREGLPGRP
jgi:hypothetical protein